VRSAKAISTVGVLGDLAESAVASGTVEVLQDHRGSMGSIG
jgi:hypothetical protein